MSRRCGPVAALKAEHPIAVAVCFAIATQSANGATLITGDPGIVERGGEVPDRATDARAYQTRLSRGS